MRIKKNKFVCVIFILLVFSLVLPIFSYCADTAYVWSEVSSPIVSTASILSEGERQFLKSYLW